MGFERDLLSLVRGGDAAAGKDYDPGKLAATAFIEGGPLAEGYENVGLPGIDLGAIADIGDLSLFNQLGGAEGGGDADAQASEQAEQGFRGTPSTVPHKELLERSFGISLDGIEAFLGTDAQAATAALGANAVASGNRMAFSTNTPDPALVAHEVMHVIQQTTGSVDIGGSGIEKTGEGQAEAVEAAVASGKRALSALDVDPRNPLGSIASNASTIAGEATNAANNVGAVAGEVSAAVKNPIGALKKSFGGFGGLLKGRPALSAAPAPLFSTGMSFSPNGFENSGTINLWRTARPITVPIVAVPGLNFQIQPGLTLGVGGGVNWREHAVTARASIDGSVTMGLSYGNPALAEVYANMQGNAGGSFTYQRSRAQGSNAGNQGANRPAERGRDTWSLTGQIVLSTAFNVGVRLGGGIIDKSFQFGQCEIGRLTGVAWRDGQFQRNQLGWQWGPQPQRFFTEMNRLLQRARQIMNLPREAAERAWQGLASGPGWAYNGARRLISAVNPFD